MNKDIRESIGKNIAELRKGEKLSLQQFADRLNAHAGKDIYSKDTIFRIEKASMKATAEFMAHVNNVFDTSIEELFYGKGNINYEFLEENPDHNIQSEKYKHFLTYAKSLRKENSPPIIEETLEKLEAAVLDMDVVLKNNIELRAKLDVCLNFMKNNISK